MGAYLKGIRTDVPRGGGVMTTGPWAVKIKVRRVGSPDGGITLALGLYNGKKWMVFHAFKHEGGWGAEPSPLMVGYLANKVMEKWHEG
jgi:hypothetical protein